MLQLTFNPVLTLTDVRTTRPWVERGREKKNSSPLNTIHCSPVSARTRTIRSGDEPTVTMQQPHLLTLLCRKAVQLFLSIAPSGCKFQSEHCKH